MAKLTYY